MKNTYFPPELYSKKFSCPHCEVYTTQSWSSMWYGQPGNIDEVSSMYHCMCDHCQKISFWFQGKMILPSLSYAPMPHEDMPNYLLDDYNEARDILNTSPRGAAALLRLVLEKLLKEILKKYDKTSQNINSDIKFLVSEGLPLKIQKSLDIVRVVGNNAVHPGRIDLKDDINTALTLFKLINIIIQNQITEPAEIESIYNETISENQRQSIEERDSKGILTTDHPAEA
ncbi:DUF4145 domain-containing protein [Paenibacillus sp. FSL R5-0341]|uniref:DUF4145 domain-containing protein n=1 Tax=Paenibacillus sp. FSL R5-0341 TaxID=2921636 RepID=UPI0030CFA562